MNRHTVRPPGPGRNWPPPTAKTLEDGVTPNPIYDPHAVKPTPPPPPPPKKSDDYILVIHPPTMLRYKF